MGSGSSKVYEPTKQGRRTIKQDWNRNLYKYQGKYWKITGNCWTGFYRSEISLTEYKRLTALYRKRFKPEIKHYSYGLKKKFNDWTAEDIQDLLGKTVLH